MVLRLCPNRVKKLNLMILDAGKIDRITHCVDEREHRNPEHLFNSLCLLWRQGLFTLPCFYLREILPRHADLRGEFILNEPHRFTVSSNHQAKRSLGHPERFSPRPVDNVCMTCIILLP